MEKRKSAVALGLFDGVHMGHRAVLELAAESGLLPSVFTFNPDAVLLKSSVGYIYTKEEKAEIMTYWGIKNICSVDFSDVCDLSGEEFVKNILINKMNAGFVCCGKNFRFGKNASCGTSELAELGKKYGFEVHIADDVIAGDGGGIISSTAIREALLAGKMVKAVMYLGNEYTISKTVVHGAHLGSTIGFPTINQIFSKGQLVPRYGVYASTVLIDEKFYGAVTNIGIKPTVDYGGMPLAETHIMNFSGDLYGSKQKVMLLKFIRPEQKFSSVEELKNQIAQDTESVLSFFKRIT